MFKVGDVVYLKSGGPNMTVEANDGNEVICVWFVGAEKKMGRFHEQTVLLDDAGVSGGR